MSYWAVGTYAVVTTAATIDQGKNQEHNARLAMEEQERMNNITEEQTRIATENAERQAREQMALAREQGEKAAQEARDRAAAAAKQQAALIQSNQQQQAAIEEAKNAPTLDVTPELDVRTGVDTARRRRRAFTPSTSVRI